jgi:signal transduction histidine kinase
MASPFSTLTARVVVAAAALTLCVVSVAFAAVYAGAVRGLEGETRQVVEAELRGLVERYREGGVVDLARTLAERTRADETGEAVYLLANGRGERIAGNLIAWPAGTPVDGSWTRVKLQRTDRPGAVVDVGARAFPVQGAYLLLVGRDMAAQRRFQSAVVHALTWAFAVSVLLALAGAWLLSRMVMGRISEIGDAAQAFMSGEHEVRLPERRGEDELNRLAVSLNAMFDRIAALMSEMRTVTDSLAHDLRTPLTRLKTHVARAADPDTERGRREQSLAEATEEADRLLASFSTMIDIARAESGVTQGQLETVDLAHVVRDVAELHQPLAEDSGMTLAVDASGPVMVRGHVQFLSQMLSNLIDNAVKYAASGGELSINVAAVSGEARLIVADRGPGVPPERRGEALKRFGRLDAARSQPGSGLGLSLAATIARLHGGRLALEDNAPGLRVVVILPLVSPSSLETPGPAA